MDPTVLIRGEQDISREELNALAQRLGAPVLEAGQDAPEDCLVLCLGPEGLTLKHAGLSVRGDFSRMLPRLKPQAISRELLVRAARVKGVASPVAIDATAGLGEDSLLLAAAGFTVKMYERNPYIAALLADALERARKDAALAKIASRMELAQADSAKALPTLGMPCDVVLLDPMFPAKQHSAASKKKLQLLQSLEQPCQDEAALLNAALAAHPRKVVVKRPLKGPALAGRKPSYAICGTTIRYDCYAL